MHIFGTNNFSRKTYFHLDVNARHFCAEIELSLQAAYGLEFNIKQKSLHLVLCILLAGNIATNPGPTTIENGQFGNLPRSHIHDPVIERSKNNVKCLGLNTRSLMSVTKTSDGGNCE